MLKYLPYVKSYVVKKNGSKRYIYKPNAQLKKRMRDTLPELERIAVKSDMHEVAHGFMPLRSPVTNAIAHIGYDYTLTFDLKDFFDQVTDAKLTNLVPDWMLKDVAEGGLLADGAARQGFPTSPLLANIACHFFDQSMFAHLMSYLVEDGKYTRYADDLSVSFYAPKMNLPHVVKTITARVHVFAANHGFKLNEHKTKLLDGRAGRRIITGVAVDKDGVYPTRKTKRKLRSARHHVAVKHRTNEYKRKARGLAEWCELKVPHIGRSARGAIRAIKNMVKDA